MFPYLQHEMHLCAAKCCENSDASLDRVQHCVENCSVPLHNAQNYVQGELESLQKRLQRCVMDCNDMIKDKMGPNPSEAEVSSCSFKRLLRGCYTVIFRWRNIPSNLISVLLNVSTNTFN